MKPRFTLTQLITILTFFVLLVVVSCVKENSQNGTAAQQEEQASMVSSEADGEAESVFNDVFDDVMGVNDDVGMAGTGVFGRNSATGISDGINTQRLTACFTVSITHATNSVFPVKVVIDFGTTGCTGPDGRVRKGKIYIEYTNRLIYPGAVATITFYEFYVGDIKIEGTQKITNTTSGTANTINRQFTIEVTNAKLSKPNGDYTEWTSNKTITQIEGIGTPLFPRDDIFKIEGSSHGKVKKGNLLVAWESKITDPLIKKFACFWIVQGTVKTVRLNTSSTSTWVAELDFGKGDCDNKAVIAINGVVHNITLH
ncbi:MAG: hypothetical protein JJE22_15605 [Bacteroidia bacterium]|nr:hypothetical protein [Bacteroidia bacterium]